jgi:hypothetical protein
MVLDRADEYMGLSRLTYLELDNQYVTNKFKYLLDEDEHFSKFEDPYTSIV